jgi:hypothetical protein
VLYGIQLVSRRIYRARERTVRAFVERRGWDADFPPRLDRLFTEVSAMRNDLARLEWRARRLAQMKPKRPSKRQRAAQAAQRRTRRPEPPRRKYQQWTADDAQAALHNWARAHGRPPTARDLTDPDLPSWGTVRKLFGGMPTLSDDSHNPKEG